MVSSTRYQHSRFFEIYGQPLLIVVALAQSVQALAAGVRDRFPDFEIFYHSALALRQGADPYTSLTALGLGPNANSPIGVLLVVPFTWLPIWPASLLWLALGLLALLWSVVVISRRTQCRTEVLLCAALALHGTALTIRQGQNVLYLTALCTAAWTAWQDRRFFISGLALALLAVLKPFYGLFGLYLLWRRPPGALAGMASMLVLTVAIMLSLQEVTASWISTLRDVNWYAHPANGSLFGLTSRLFAFPPTMPYTISTVPFTSSNLLRVLGFVVLAAGVAAVSVRALKRTDDASRQWTIVSLAAILLSPLAEVHYFLVMMAPMAAVVPGMRSAAWLWPLGAALAIPFVLVDASIRGSWTTATIGSVYAWATLGAWWQITRAQSVR